MLRIAVLILGVVLIALGLPVLSVGWGPGPALAGSVLVLGILAERKYYKRLGADAPGPGWVETGERFIDPETQRPVTVFWRKNTGERRYVAR